MIDLNQFDGKEKFYMGGFENDFQILLAECKRQAEAIRELKGTLGTIASTSYSDRYCTHDCICEAHRHRKLAMDALAKLEGEK